MFCPGCGQEVRGVTCPRCGVTLPRSRGATVVIEQDETEAPPQAAPSGQIPAAPTPYGNLQPAVSAPSYQAPAAQAPYAPAPAQPQQVFPASGAAADPFAQTGYAPGGQPPPHTGLGPAQPSEAQLEPAPIGWSPAPPDSRRGLVWRGVFGSISLMLGTPAILFAIFVTVAILATQRGVRADLIAVAVGVIIIGTLDVVAGALVLKGAPSPHVIYVISLVVQLLASLTMAILVILEIRAADADEIFMVALIFTAPLFLPLVRLIPLFLSSSGEVLGSRDGGGMPMRPVPFVLWGPIVTLLASPLFAFALLSIAIGLLTSLGSDTAMLSIFAVVGLILFVFSAGLAGGVVGMLKRARWSVAVGGVTGAIGVLASLGLFVGLNYDTVSRNRFSDDDLGMSATAAFIITAALVPSLSLLVGAIKFGFRLPAYLNEPAGTPRRKLMQVLVPQDG